jgi:hypothetical protein
MPYRDEYSDAFVSDLFGCVVISVMTNATSSKRLNTNLYADFGSDLPERFDFGFNKDAGKIASTCVPADRQIEDFSVIRKQTTPNKIERFGLLGQYDSTISKGECIGAVANRLAMTARFKFRIRRSLLEEVRESRIEITQRSLLGFCHA